MQEKFKVSRRLSEFFGVKIGFSLKKHFGVGVGSESQNRRFSESELESELRNGNFSESELGFGVKNVDSAGP